MHGGDFTPPEAGFWCVVVIFDPLGADSWYMEVIYPPQKLVPGTWG